MAQMLDIDRGERIEMMVDIYESSDSVRNDEVMINTERQQALQHTGSVSEKNRRHRAVQVCLWLLFVLPLTAVIVLCVYFTTDRNRLLTHNYNLIKQKEKLFKDNNKILNQNRNLTEEREQIKTKTDELQDDLSVTKHHISNLTKENELLLTNNTNLLEEKDRCMMKSKSVSEERDQLMNQRKDLNRWLTKQDRSSDNFKWVYYNFSFYYFSSAYKSWSNSRQDCKERKADLVIINSKEEQEFLQKVTAGYYFWIGLRKEKEVWKWINETPSTTSFWMNGYPRQYNNYCALTYTSGLADDSCDDNYGWICEKSFKSLIV
ncbi:asialoglycoprotein receptor 1-like [Triplophysa dalaica]|uniref:asialoglycoprotein receptor 1-like n=1 Tax=Triplophysa dalaica TaxID=1582913 RepID=UPI0024DFE211|nr:asialoglycoprotein receptor 1-like [Triplophysa dalaica]